MTWSSKYNKTTDRYAIPAALVSAIGGSSEGNATKTTPAEGFSESGLASLFGSTFVAPSAANSSTTPQKPKSTGQKRAIIAGSLLGSLTLVVLIGAAFWYFRRGLQKFVLGDITETHEVDGTGKNAGELPGKAHFWELPGTEPAELWSPTITDSSGMSPEMFKHETSSDKDLGWRGPVSPLELEESAVSPLGSEKTAIDPMELEESAVSPLGSEKTAINPLEQEKGVQVEVKRIQDGDSDSVINMPCETQEQPKELG
ncbi:MAG: hypothetical protein LQ342_007079 [Letrouitia transgressa]|nr:MAG: hypothetical protein LQ342_007079 [Letrouitia transgressa]